MNILLLEDSSTDADLIRIGLIGSIPGCMVTIAQTLKQGKDILERNGSFDIALLDMKLSEGIGMDRLMEIRHSQSDLPVIILTEPGNEEVATAALKAGADNHIIKSHGYIPKLPGAIDYAIKNHMQNMGLTPASYEKTLVMQDENNRPTNISGVTSDISRKKLYEEELVKAKEKAEESDRLKSAFLINMSNEIRTPMNGILGFAGLLKEPGLTREEQQDYLKIIEKSGARMLNIINDIVDSLKIESGLMELNLTESNINEQIEYTCNFFRSEVEKKGIQLHCNNSLPDMEAIIRTDREKFLAILSNLVKNAIKYTHKGSIEIGYKIVETHVRAQNIEPQPSLQFYVKDTGIGIPKDRHEAIFERFIQADNSEKLAYQGTGLGLSISKAYVEMLGGKIWVESEPGKGSIFYFTLPYNGKRQKVTALANDPSPEVDVTPIKKIRVLIAEDDQPSEMLISIALKPISFEVLKVTNGAEAVEVCRNTTGIDLVLMDIQMPIMNGYEATKQIRKFNKEVVIIAQTAFGHSGDRERAIMAGCNDYISKPLNMSALKNLIRRYFD